jgi:hypothetical protein
MHEIPNLPFPSLHPEKPAPKAPTAKLSHHQPADKPAARQTDHQDRAR